MERGEWWELCPPAEWVWGGWMMCADAGQNAFYLLCLPNTCDQGHSRAARQLFTGLTLTRNLCTVNLRAQAWQKKWIKTQIASHPQEGWQLWYKFCKVLALFTFTLSSNYVVIYKQINNTWLNLLAVTQTENSDKWDSDLYYSLLSHCIEKIQVILLWRPRNSSTQPKCKESWNIIIRHKLFTSFLTAAGPWIQKLVNVTSMHPDTDKFSKITSIDSDQRWALLVESISCKLDEVLCN